MRRKNATKRKNKKKRKSTHSGASADKRQRLSGDVSEIGETKESDALPVIPLPVITKEDRAVARLRQGHAKQVESLSKPCIAIIYRKMKGKCIKRKYIKGPLVQIGDPMTFSSRVKAGKCFGGMNPKTIGSNIASKGRTKIKGGEYEGLYVMLSNKPVEPIMFEGIEIKAAPVKSEYVKGQKYIHNGKVRIWDGGGWKCVEHNKRLSRCGECGGAAICPCGIQRNGCRICRVQPLHQCTVCPQTCVSAFQLVIHMCTHTGEKPYGCHLCSFKSSANNSLTSHKGRIHDIGNEECTICQKNCYRPRSWIDPVTTEEERSCKECYQERCGVDIREEQEWSDWLDERFYPTFRTCSNTRLSQCTLFRPDGLYEFEGPMILYFEHLILHWEFDEHHHQDKAYSGDENRMLKMHGIEKYRGKQWVTVRINPHAYTHPARKAKPEKEERKKLMLKVMKACLTKKWESRSHVVYLFYSKDNNNIAQNISKTMLYDAEDVENFCI